MYAFSSPASKTEIPVFILIVWLKEWEWKRLLSYVRENKEFPKFVEVFSLSLGFPGGSDGKESACSAGDPGSIPGEGNGYPLQYSCLEGYSPWGHKESDTTEQLNNNNNPIVCILMTLRYQG